MSSLPLSVGDQIHGFAGGLFGRDHYVCVTVEHVARDWVVLRGTHPDSSGAIRLLYGSEDLRSAQYERDHPDRWHCTGADGCRPDDAD